MVLHGYIDYAGKSQNEYSADNTAEHFLKLVEYGCGLRYSWIYGENSLLKDSGLPYSAAHYTDGLEQAAARYKYLQKALGGLAGVPITEHKIIRQGLRKVTYQDSVSIYVNYNDVSEQADGLEIGAKSFYVSEGGK